MTTIIAHENNIIFRFIEDITDGRFINSSKSGLIISTKDNNQSNLPRWGLVEAIGPNVLDVKVGEYVLVEPGKWTNGFYVDDLRYWKTDDTYILAASDEPDVTY